MRARSEPVEHAKRTEGVPAARLPFAVLHLEMRLTLVDILERPSAVWIAIPLDDANCLGDALVRRVAGVPEVVEGAQNVVEVPVRERELEPALVDHLAGRFPAEQSALE